MIKNQKGGPKFKKDLKFKGAGELNNLIGIKFHYSLSLHNFRSIIVNYLFIVTCPHHKNVPQNAT